MYYSDYTFYSNIKQKWWKTIPNWKLKNRSDTLLKVIYSFYVYGYDKQIDTYRFWIEMGT